ncbi:LuxR C-terminal-related transcriptional regulator [Micromonospora sp. NPDC049559]|uniref:helix-turn-helix transcriptional regulator n=1 Tax=Micromonospora sp. NPDC049559 TaxID=3155923 RepID=UPI003414DD36
MRHVPGGTPAGPTAPDTMAAGPGGGRPTAPRPGGGTDPADGADRLVGRAAALLTRPGLVVLHGGPGAGRTHALRRLADAFHGPVFGGNALASLRSVPAFALSHALRVRLPAHDPALLVEAVRAVVRGGLLLVDDLQWADPVTVAALGPVAEHCRVAVALRTPHRLPDAAVAALRAAAAGWLAVAPLDAAGATALARTVAPGLAAPAVARVVRRAGGTPLAVTALARHAARHGTDGDPDRAAPTGTAPDGDPATTDRLAAPGGDRVDLDDDGGPGLDGGLDELTHAVATALADLSRPARTAMAALGLLGHPAPAALLGPGVAELTGAGLVTAAPDGTGVAAVSPYTAEVAAGLLDDQTRRDLHRRLADLVPPARAARHLAAAGEPAAAYRAAVTAATTASSAAHRADLLLFACDLPGVTPAPADRLAAARAALTAGRPAAAAAVLAGVDGAHAAATRAEALLQLGDLVGAAATAARIPEHAEPDLAAARDRITLLTRLAGDPSATAGESLAGLVARHGPAPTHPGLRAALAAAGAAARIPGWEAALATAASAAGTAGDTLAARWSAWLLVETLLADGRLTEAADAAGTAADACAADSAYGWQTRFLAARLWCEALTGGPGGDDVARRAGDLTDRTLPALARGYAVAAAALVEADGGLLAPARARLAATTGVPAPAGPVLDWVGREAAWLDGQPERAVAPPAADRAPLVDGLCRITARWAAHDGAAAPADDGHSRLPPVRRTLTAWTAPERFDAAAAAWRGLAVREEVRCLLARGLLADVPQRAVEALLAAEALAERAGLVVLLGRVRRALRRHAVRREERGPRAGTDLTDRERQVLRLVAAGAPSRRIAGQLGISAQTVETHIRAGMRKLGARTRTEAAARVLAQPVVGTARVPPPRPPEPAPGDAAVPLAHGGPTR